MLQHVRELHSLKHSIEHIVNNSGIRMIHVVPGGSGNARGNALQSTRLSNHDAEHAKLVQNNIERQLQLRNKILKSVKKRNFSPGWCGSVDGVLACEPKGGFPVRARLQARSLVGGVREATDRCISHALLFLSLSFSLPSHVSKYE